MKSNRRWMKSVLKTDVSEVHAPWARTNRRNRAKTKAPIRAAS